MRLLFVSNGHGEMAIAARIASEARQRGAVTDHFPLVGVAVPQDGWISVGPQRAMPSGGLVAMGNARAFAADLRAGLLSLWRRQRAFLRDAARDYDALVAVGDAYCLFMALAARRRVVFVGTAKSAYVAPYGPFERRLMRRARRVFVRDRATAEALRKVGVPAEAPGNVIADLARSEQRFPWRGAIRCVVLPGSRAGAYRNAAQIGRVLAQTASPQEIDVAVSVAPGLEARRMLDAVGIAARAWDGDLGGLFAGATLAVGQAGTANEAAAAAGIPVVALVDPAQKREDWYRMRQRRLLDGALALVSADPQRGAEQLRALLGDARQLEEMARVGRERMGPPGGAAAIADAAIAVAR